MTRSLSSSFDRVECSGCGQEWHLMDCGGCGDEVVRRYVPEDKSQIDNLRGAIVPRRFNAERYTILVCPSTGQACVDHDHDPIPMEVVPAARLAEVVRARDELHERLSRLQETRSTVLMVGQVPLFGSRENVEKAKWTLAHLTAKGKAA